MRHRIMKSMSLSLCLVVVCLCGLAAEQSPFALLATYQLGAANYESKITGVTFCPADGRYLLLSCQDYGGFAVVDTQDWHIVASPPAGYSKWISFSPDWSKAAFYGGVYDAATWRKLWDFGGLQGLLNSDTWQPFSPDGGLLLCPGKPITTWDVTTGGLRQRLYLLREIQPMALVFADNGARIIAAWNNQGQVEIASWETSSGTPLPSLATQARGWFGGPAFGGAVFSSDAKLLALQGGSRITIVDVATGAATATFSTQDGGGPILGLTFIAGTRVLASGTSAAVTLSAVPSGQQLATFEGDPAGLNAFGVSADGRRLAVGGGTGRVDLYDISALLAYSCSGFSISKVDWIKGCITIRNSTSWPLDLLGWKISDGDKSFTFEASVPVAGGESYVACAAIYNPSNSSRGLRIDETDDQITLYSPELCGGTKESTKRQ